VPLSQSSIFWLGGGDGCHAAGKITVGLSSHWPYGKLRKGISTPTKLITRYLLHPGDVCVTAEPGLRDRVLWAQGPCAFTTVRSTSCLRACRAARHAATMRLLPPFVCGHLLMLPAMSGVARYFRQSVAFLSVHSRSAALPSRPYNQ